jgi:hypothetical protein
MNQTISHPLRINEQLQQYWYELRADRPLPFENEVNTDALSEIWPHCFLIKCLGNKFAYAYLGDSLVEAYGDNLTGREITETLLYPHPASLLKTFQAVYDEAIPRMDDSHFINSHGTEIRYRSCVLPLATSGRSGVAFLLGGMKWKGYETNPA